MKIVTTIAECRSARKEFTGGGSVVFIPTMGALHEGHGNLLQMARELAGVNGLVVSSIFVNPLQFGPHEDFSRYPRPFEADVELLQQRHTDLLFAPPLEQMYPEGKVEITVDPGPLGDILEGALRPGHFRGVCTVVAKLLAIVQSDVLILGQKDYQQQVVLRRMAADLDYPVQVLTAPTVRESDGLAMSSRNQYLNPDQRKRAAAIYAALSWAAEEIRAGRNHVAPLTRGMQHRIAAAGMKVDYVVPCHTQTLAAYETTINGPCVVLAAAKLGSTRLIDNVIV
ncbi:MAG TPA: pantoate--beta-alanine ligase [Phycisphaerae bacterium]|nr:pantoate--beta-alanine ligase [Phycisphaerae bacterium]